MAFNDNIYTVYWKKLAIWLLPILMRNGLMRWLSEVVASPNNDLFNKFIQQHDYVAYWIEIDSQVWRMEKALNDKYDSSGKRIRIVDAVEYLPLIIYQPEENKPLPIYQRSENMPQVLYTLQETAMFSVDFVVQVPAIAFDAREMRAFIDRFKTPSKTYSIQVI